MIQSQGLLVACRDGAVTLSGTVGSYAEEQQAGLWASEDRGVKEIQDNIGTVGSNIYSSEGVSDQVGYHRSALSGQPKSANLPVRLARRPHRRRKTAHMRSLAMDLELATTVDVIEELRQRGMHFVFVGMPGSNTASNELYFACQGISEGELLRMVLLMQKSLRQHGQSQ